MSSYKTEEEVFREGYKAFANSEINDYLPNTWAYKAFNRGYQQAASDYLKEQQQTTVNHGEKE